ncbi:MAG: hemerythrin family protein [Planctomycetes bacterium]|nr:hemerythrin family protein [Planctomycetota bacterium]
MLWSPIYETGIPIVDAQHQELFRQIENLLDKSKGDRVQKTLDFLGSYVVKHFTTEEGLQKSCNYPNFDNHHKMHETFTKTYLDLKDKYQAGQDPLLLMKISNIALTWLKDHIRVQDQDFAKHFKAKSGAATGGATAAAEEEPAVSEQSKPADQPALSATKQQVAVSPASRAVPQQRTASRPSPALSKHQQVRAAAHAQPRRPQSQRASRLSPIPTSEQFGNSKQTKYSHLKVSARSGASRSSARPISSRHAQSPMAIAESTATGAVWKG